MGYLIDWVFAPIKIKNAELNYKKAQTTLKLRAALQVFRLVR